MRIYKARGIILKRRNVGETDRILTVFTSQYGKLRCIARGIRKVSSRRAPHLELFTFASFVMHKGKAIDSISEVVPVNVFEGVRGDIKRVSIAYFYCELVDRLIPEKQEHADIFTLLREALEALATESNIYEQSKAFALELLWLLGFLPRSKSLSGPSLQSFIENITERRLHTPRFARRIASW